MIVDIIFVGDVKRLLAIYYRQDLTTEVFHDFDGEEYVAHG